MPARISRLFLASILLSTLSSTLPLQAQTASLVRDITQTSSSSPFDLGGSSPNGLFPFHNKLFYTATEPSSGKELWVSDGSSGGTRLLADFCPGTCDSNPSILGASKTAVLGIEIQNDFYTSTGYFLWRSDGTRTGTYLLPNADDPVSLAFDYSSGTDTAMLGDFLYFSGCNQGQGCGLWRSDGTASGTQKLQPNDSSGYGINQLTSTGKRLFYVVNQTLVSTAGTAASTHDVQTFNASLAHLTALGDKLFFTTRGSSQTEGDELWVSDGTTAGTQPLTSFQAPQPFDQTLWLKAIGGKLYFVADDVTHGAEIWSTDGTATGTVRITEIGYSNPFSFDGYSSDGTGLRASELELLGSQLVFWATDGINGYQPWATTGLPGATAPLCSGCSFSNPHATLVKIGNRLLFRGQNAANGSEIWTTDGTVAGTTLLRDACPGICDGALSEPVALLGSGFFVARPSATSGNTELWRSDGTTQGTRRFSAPGPYNNSNSGSGFTPSLAAIGSRLFFAAADPVGHYGVELWASNGTPVGTGIVADASRDKGSSDIENLTALGSNVVFSVCDQYQERLWRSDGTAAGTLQSPDFVWNCGASLNVTSAAGTTFFTSSGYSNGDQLWRLAPDGSSLQLTALPQGSGISQTAVLGDRLYFVVGNIYGDAQPLQIWKSDGTVQGTIQVITLPVNLQYLRGLQAAGSELWFSVIDTESQGGQIWHSNGTQAGTRLAVDFGDDNVASSDPHFTQAGANVFFIGPDDQSNDEIWKSDGTPQGTVLVRDLDQGSFPRASPQELTAFQGNLYFFAMTADGHPGLWRTDGTAAGTVLIKSFEVDPNNPYSGPPPAGLTALGPWLLFASDDGVHGKEIWRSDGTAVGTILLRDILPGAMSSGITSLFKVGDRVLFSADDGVHGFEPWQSDGTAEGTRLLQDIAPEESSSFPGHFTLAGNRIFFTADDGLTGEELWELPLGSSGCQPSTTALCLSGGRFRVEIVWRDFAGNTGTGQAVPLSADTGYFWFFDPANVETVVKVLDGRGSNGHFWVFYGALSNVEYTLTVTDTQTGLTHRYFNPLGQFASVGDTRSFGPLGSYVGTTVAPPSPPSKSEVSAAAATGTCVPGPGRLCLNGGRFSVQATWKANGQTGSGHAVGLTGDTGYFWFFDPANVEAVIKVLDGTQVNGHFWVYYGALSNVEYTLTVTDTMTGHVKTYQNPQGRFASVGDGAAF